VFQDRTVCRIKSAQSVIFVIAKFADEFAAIDKRVGFLSIILTVTELADILASIGKCVIALPAILVILLLAGNKRGDTMRKNEMSLFTDKSIGFSFRAIFQLLGRIAHLPQIP